MRTARVCVRADDFEVLMSTRTGNIIRYFTDATLPYELKWRLGMLMFGLDDPLIGFKMADAHQTYYVRVPDETFYPMIGMEYDTRSESQSEGKADTV